MTVGERVSETMPRKIIIDAENFTEDIEQDIREGYKKMRDHGRRGFENIKKKVHHHISRDVKLFTNKKEMVNYVNELADIQNVEVFKIDDDLYKVLVTRRRKNKECCSNKNHEEKE